MSVRVGVLALQGDFAEHASALEAAGCEPFEVRTPAQLEPMDGLIIPGGESTTIGRLAISSGLLEPLKEFAQSHAVWGTCAGAIVLARRIENDSMHLGVLDITIRRNAFGRQIDSFVAPLSITGIDGEPYRAVFIRAPIISAAGPSVEVLAKLEDGRIVAVRQGCILATSFHPELTPDLRVHKYFLRMIQTG